MSCPDLEELESYASSQLDPPARQAVAEHLASCRECSSQLVEISENRRILAPLRELFAAASAESEPLPREIGSYRLLRELGRGGSGIVYEAEQREPRRRVAVKLLARPRGGGPGSAGLLRREAEALARLRHPSIAAIYEAGRAPDGRPYFAMELVDGEPLVAYARRRQLPLHERLSLFATVCEAVSYAHQRGVIHRDLKPSNILVEEEASKSQTIDIRRNERQRQAVKTSKYTDGNGNGQTLDIRRSGRQGQEARARGAPKVLDFGLARILNLETEPSAPTAETPMYIGVPEDAPPQAGMAQTEKNRVHPRASAVDSQESAETALSEVGRVFGTLPYMSPEHLRGDPHEIDVRSDVYTLGVILFELLTDKLPYSLERGNLAQAARIICEQPPSNPRSLVRDLPEDVATIVLKALERAPQSRFQSAAEFAADIRRYLRHEPIVARPPTAWYRFRKFVRRNRGLAATVAASIVLLLGASGAAIAQAVIATRERDAAERRLELALQSANYVFFGVSGQVARVPGTRGIQRHIAEEAYAFYRRIADESPEDPMEHAGLWAATRKLAVLAVEDGRLDRARVLADLVREEVQHAADMYPDDPRIMSELGLTFRLLAGVSEAEGDPTAARRNAARTLELARQAADWYEQHVDVSDPDVWVVPDSGPFAGRQPEHLTARFFYAEELIDAAGRALGTGELDNAEQHYRDALSIVEYGLATDPTVDPMYRQDLSDYAPLAGPILLRFGMRSGYESMRAAVLSGLQAVAERHENVDAGNP